jgi:hypothetical protein
MYLASDVSDRAQREHPGMLKTEMLVTTSKSRQNQKY